MSGDNDIEVAFERANEPVSDNDVFEPHDWKAFANATAAIVDAAYELQHGLSRAVVPVIKAINASIPAFVIIAKWLNDNEGMQ